MDKARCREIPDTRTSRRRYRGGGGGRHHEHRGQRRRGAGGHRHRQNNSGLVSTYLVCFRIPSESSQTIVLYEVSYNL